MARTRSARRGDDHFPEPNMIPLMNVILMLICSLVTMAGSLPLGLLNSKAQELASAQAVAPEQAEQKKPLALILFITKTGFNISVQGDVKMGEADPQNSSRKLPLVPLIPGPDGTGAYDWKALQTKLAEMKKLDPSEELMTITADPEVKFDAIVKAMDWARVDADKNILFPKVAFAAGIVG